MNITYFADKKLFKLDTPGTTYAMEIRDSGILTHCYWGPRLQRADDIPTGAEVMREINFHSFIRDETAQEYMPWGGYYYDENTLKAEFPDGVRDVRLRYRFHTVAPGDDKSVLAVVLGDEKYPLQVELIYEIYPDCDIIDRHCIITNTGSYTIILEKAFSALWRLPYRKEWRLTHLSGKWGGEYQIERQPVTQSKTVLETRTGTSGYDHCPLIMLDDGSASEERSDVYFGSVQWSGNWKIIVEKTRFSEVLVTGGINDFDFSWPLKAGEAFETPRFTGGLSREGFGGSSRMIHTYQRRHLMTPVNANRIVPIVYNSWGTFLFDIDEKRMIELAKLAAQTGAELFVIDDGWFGSRDDERSGLGDWIPHPGKFPNGLNPLIKAVNEAGMGFGIWVEPEMVNPDSDLYRAHPDWVFHFPGRVSHLGRNQLVLNLSREDVCEYIWERMDWLLGNHNIAYLKFDNNRFITEPGCPDAPTDEQKTALR